MIAVARELVVLSITVNQCVGTDDSTVITVTGTEINTSHCTVV
jgi:hypothetical protein